MFACKTREEINSKAIRNIESIFASSIIRLETKRDVLVVGHCWLHCIVLSKGFKNETNHVLSVSRQSIYNNKTNNYYSTNPTNHLSLSQNSPACHAMQQKKSTFLHSRVIHLLHLLTVLAHTYCIEAWMKTSGLCWKKNKNRKIMKIIRYKIIYLQKSWSDTATVHSFI